MAITDVSKTFIADLDAGRVPIVSKDGRLRTVDLSNLDEAITTLGFRQATTEEIKEGKLRLEKQGFFGTLEAFGTAAASTATLGAFPLLWTEGGTTWLGKQKQKQLQALREEHKVASEVGEWAGILGPALVPGLGEAAGAGTAIKTLAKAAPISLLSSASKASEKVIANNLAKVFIKDGIEAGVAKRFAIKLAPKVIAQAGEGAGFGAGITINESIFEDKELTAESLLAGMTTGALFGAAVPVVMDSGALVSKFAANKMIQKSNQLIKTLRETLSKDFNLHPPQTGMETTLKDRISDIISSGAAQKYGSSEVEKTAIKKAFSSGEKELRNIIKQSESEFEKTTIKFTKDVEESIKNLDDIVYDIEKKITNIHQKQTANAIKHETFNAKEILENNPIIKIIDDINKNIVTKIDNIATKDNEFKEAFNKKYKAIIHDYGLKSNYYINKGIESVKQNEINEGIQVLTEYQTKFMELINSVKMDLPNVSDNKLVEELNDSIANHLSNETLYGKTAEIYNKLHYSLLPYEKMRNNLIIETGNIETKKLDANKVGKFVQEAGKNDNMKKILFNYLDYSQRLINTSNEILATSYASISKKNFEEFVNNSSIREQILKLKNNSKDEKSLPLKLLFTVLGFTGGFGGLEGIAGGITGYGFSHGLSDIKSVFTDPMKLIKGISFIENAYTNASEKLTKNANNFVTERTKKAIKQVKLGDFARTITVPAAEKILDDFDIFDITSEKVEKYMPNMGLEEKYKKRFNQLSNLINSPEQLGEILSGSIQGMNAVAPELSQQLTLKATDTLNFLYEKAPKQKQADIFNEWKPSKSEIKKWVKYVRAVENPMIIFDELKSGIVNTETIETIQKLYPRLYEQIVSEIIDSLAKVNGKVSYSKQLQINKLLGKPNVILAQSIYKNEENTKAQIKMPNIASQSQRISNR